MSRDSGGNYTLAANNPVASGTTIESGWANNTLDDLAEAMTDSLSRTGKGLMSVPFRGVDGTQGAPGLAFVNESGTGFYRNGTGDLIATALGEPIARINSTFGFQMFVNGVWVTPANSESGDAIAANVSYDNSGSGLTATQVQQAIDELVTQATTGVRIQGTWNPSTNTISGDPAGNVAITKGASPSGYTNPAGVGYAISEDGTFDLNDSGSDTMLKGNTIIWSEGGASQWNQTASSSYATNVVYDNTNTGLVAENVQDALDEGIPYAKAGRKNVLINGDFRVAQRGASFDGLGDKYTLDRWFFWDGAGDNSTLAQSFTEVNSPESLSTTCRITQTATGQLYTAIGQMIEDGSLLSGKTVTFSAYIRNDIGSSDVSLQICRRLKVDPNTYANWVVLSSVDVFDLTTSWTDSRRSVTASLPFEDDRDDYYYGVRIVMNDPGSSEIHYITGVQLEEGTEATDFEYRPIAEELALCQRYTQVFGSSAVEKILGSGWRRVADTIEFVIPTPVEVRAAPSGNFSDFTIRARGNGAATTTSGLSSSGVSASGIRVAGAATGIAASHAYTVTIDDAGTLILDSEL